MFRKIIAAAVIFSLVFEQSGFAQVAGQMGIPAYINGYIAPDRFRPVQLRSISYDAASRDIDLFLDKGDLKDIKAPVVSEAAVEFMRYFKTGLALPNDTFWVNLRPDAPDNIIDPLLEKSDIGRIMLAADLQLKKDLARFTNPDTQEGRQYWDKLYARAEQLFGADDITIPTVTRPWIVPGEVILRQSNNNAFIYKATLNVMLEQDYLQDTSVTFDDPRLKAINEYSSQLLRSLIIPKLVREVNSSKKYSQLRQIYYCLILAQWFKSANKNKTSSGIAESIDSKDLSGLMSSDQWSKDTYFQAYRKSFSQGEYHKEETVSISGGMTIRTYVSGGVRFAASALLPKSAADNGLIVDGVQVPWDLIKNFIRYNPVSGITIPQRISPMSQPTVAADGGTGLDALKKYLSDSSEWLDSLIQDARTLRHDRWFTNGILSAAFIFGIGLLTDRWAMALLAGIITLVAMDAKNPWPMLFTSSAVYYEKPFRKLFVKFNIAKLNDAQRSEITDTFFMTYKTALESGYYLRTYGASVQEMMESDFEARRKFFEWNSPDFPLGQKINSPLKGMSGRDGGDEELGDPKEHRARFLEIYKAYTTRTTEKALITSLTPEDIQAIAWATLEHDDADIQRKLREPSLFERLTVDIKQQVNLRTAFVAREYMMNRIRRISGNQGASSFDGGAGSMISRFITPWKGIVNPTIQQLEALRDGIETDIRRYNIIRDAFAIVSIILGTGIAVTWILGIGNPAFMPAGGVAALISVLIAGAAEVVSKAKQTFLLDPVVKELKRSSRNFHSRNAAQKGLMYQLDFYWVKALTNLYKLIQKYQARRNQDSNGSSGNLNNSGIKRDGGMADRISGAREVIAGATVLSNTLQPISARSRKDESTLGLRSNLVRVQFLLERFNPDAATNTDKAITWTGDLISMTERMIRDIPAWTQHVPEQDRGAFELAVRDAIEKLSQGKDSFTSSENPVKEGPGAKDGDTDTHSFIEHLREQIVKAISDINRDGTIMYLARSSGGYVAHLKAFTNSLKDLPAYRHVDMKAVDVRWPEQEKEIIELLEDRGNIIIDEAGEKISREDALDRAHDREHMVFMFSIKNASGNDVVGYLIQFFAIKGTVSVDEFEALLKHQGPIWEDFIAQKFGGKEPSLLAYMLKQMLEPFKKAGRVRPSLIASRTERTYAERARDFLLDYKKDSKDGGISQLIDEKTGQAIHAFLTGWSDTHINTNIRGIIALKAHTQGANEQELLYMILRDKGDFFLGLNEEDEVFVKGLREAGVSIKPMPITCMFESSFNEDLSFDMVLDEVFVTPIKDTVNQLYWPENMRGPVTEWTVVAGTPDQEESFHATIIAAIKKRNEISTQSNKSKELSQIEAGIKSVTEKARDNYGMSFRYNMVRDHLLPSLRANFNDAYMEFIEKCRNPGFVLSPQAEVLLQTNPYFFVEIAIPESIRNAITSWVATNKAEAPGDPVIARLKVMQKNHPAVLEHFIAACQDTRYQFSGAFMKVEKVLYDIYPDLIEIVIPETTRNIVKSILLVEESTIEKIRMLKASIRAGQELMANLRGLLRGADEEKKPGFQQSLDIVITTLEREKQELKDLEAAWAVIESRKDGGASNDDLIEALLTDLMDAVRGKDQDAVERLTGQILSYFIDLSLLGKSPVHSKFLSDFSDGAYLDKDSIRIVEDPEEKLTIIQRLKDPNATAVDPLGNAMTFEAAEELAKKDDTVFILYGFKDQFNPDWMKFLIQFLSKKKDNEDKDSVAGAQDGGDHFFQYHDMGVAQQPAAEKTYAGVDFRALPVNVQPALNVPVVPVNAISLQALDEQWSLIRKQLSQGKVPYKELKQYATQCCSRADASRQKEAVTECVMTILKMEEERALATAPELKEILCCLG